jgi:hypothetical protein
MNKTFLSKHGNSLGIHLPANIFKKSKIGQNDALFLDRDEPSRIIISII